MTDPKAGRELDREIATTVMGWTPIDAKYLTQLMSPPSDWGNRGTGFVWFGGTRACEVPHFSTSIADAWLVVEKMAAWRFEISRDERTPGEVKYRAMVYPRSVEYPTAWGGAACRVGDSAPLAICLAVLRAVEHAQSGVTNAGRQ